MRSCLLILSLGLPFACVQPVRADFMSQVLGDNPAGFWILSDATTTAADSSGNAFNGTYESGVTPRGTAGPAWVPGSGLVADFDGSGNITFQAPLNLGANGYTIQAWIKPTLASLQNPTRIVASGRGGDGYGFGTTSGGDLIFTTFSVADYVTTTVTLLPNQWQYVGVVLDAGNDAHFYVNGALAESVAGILPTQTPSQDFTLGSRSPIPDEFFTGGIAGVSVYDSALTPAQIQAQFDAFVPIPEPSTLVLAGLGAFCARCILRRPRGKAGSPAPH